LCFLRLDHPIRDPYANRYQRSDGQRGEKVDAHSMSVLIVAFAIM
jgi:hypothetical protein